MTNIKELHFDSSRDFIEFLFYKISNNRQKIKQWFENHWKLTPAPLYGSVDIRNAGYKISPVDMNLFPAGFNNLPQHAIMQAALQMKQTINSLAPNAQKIALVPESFTRNPWYWKNIGTLQQILTQAGFKVTIATLPHLQQPDVELATAPLQRHGNILTVGSDFCPELILLNNDLSAGIPPILQHIDQLIMPPPELGWHSRKKSQHFKHYLQLSQELADILAIDPWFIAPFTQQSQEVNMYHGIGLEDLQTQTQHLLSLIENKYTTYGIDLDPFVIIKAESGTHGMAVMSVYNPEQLAKLNRKQRNAMAKIKNNIAVKQVIIQEGIYTTQHYGPDLHNAESVVYLCGREVIGGFYRVNDKHRNTENLNSSGMYFIPWSSKEINPPLLEVYYLIAQLSMLASAKEIGDRT